MPVLNKSLLFNDMPMEYVTDGPASARDLSLPNPAVATSLVAISDSGANLIIKSFLTLTVGAHSITQSTHIRSLGVRLDAELTIELQITDMCKTAYYHIKKINKIRKNLTDDTTKTLVHSLASDRSS